MPLLVLSPPKKNIFFCSPKEKEIMPPPLPPIENYFSENVYKDTKHTLNVSLLFGENKGKLRFTF